MLVLIVPSIVWVLEVKFRSHLVSGTFTCWAIAPDFVHCFVVVVVVGGGLDWPPTQAVAKDDLGFLILLPLPPKSWDDTHLTPLLACKMFRGRNGKPIRSRLHSSFPDHFF